MHTPELDGFRALAVTMVFVAHVCYGSRLPLAVLSWMPEPLRQVITHGWLGVDLFFILSCLLITGILVDSKNSAAYFRNFYGRRALRILPLYLTCIAVMSIAYRGYGSYFVLSLGFLANFDHLFHVPEPHGPGVFWSLSIEEHFYLLWPLLVYFLNRSHLLLLSILIVGVTPILRGVCAAYGMDANSEIYMYSFFRFDGLALGAALAIWVRSRYFTSKHIVILVTTLGGLALAITVIGRPYGIMQGQSVASAALRYTQAEFLFAAAIASALALGGSTLTAPLRSRVAKFVSDRSYCIYLIHLALIDLYLWTMHSLNINDIVSLGPVLTVCLRLIILGVTTLLIASLSRRFLEGPFLQLKRYF